MKKLIQSLTFCGLLLILSGLIIENKTLIVDIYNGIVKSGAKEIEPLTKNAYYRDYDFSYVQNTDKFTPECYQDLLNVYYTIINSGEDEYTFYCGEGYNNCLNDVQMLANSKEILSNINNFVHPYNGFNHIETKYDNYGKITVIVHKSYTPNDILEIDEKLDYIEQNVVDKKKTATENIKLIHDYIVNNSKYHSAHTENDKSEIAYGPLIKGLGICGGYTDAMELMLERLNIKSYKVSSTSHIWNAVELDNKWYHLDLTWDDPVTTDNTDILDDTFILIDTKKLQEIEPVEHIFDKNCYLELKEA